VPIDSVERVRKSIGGARARGLSVSVAGTRHSEGGQSSAAGSLNLDMMGLRGAELLDDGRHVRVGAGATWAEVQARLLPAGRAVKVMQTSNIFSVGGSLSVNCHGRTPGVPPIIATVRSLTLVNADGELRLCGREQNRELFRHAIGGYGLFGVIVEAELETTDDPFCRMEVELLAAREYPSAFAATLADPTVELVFGRLAPTLNGEALIYRVHRVDDAPAVQGGTREAQASALWHFALEASKHGRPLLALRWALERRTRSQGELARRNDFMAASVASLRQYRLNEGRAVEILHEYYVPRARYWDFVEGLDAVQRNLGLCSLNITIRDVGRDEESALPYAREDSFAFSLYYRQVLRRDAIAQQGALQRALIDLAVSLGGTFYLPYQLHYAEAQLLAAYPGIDAFWQAKHRLDPEGVFSNTFFERYGRQPGTAAALGPTKDRTRAPSR